MQDEDTVTELRDRVRRARDQYESLVRLEEQYSGRDWIDTAIDRAAAALSGAEQALTVALEPPPPPIVSDAPPQSAAPLSALFTSERVPPRKPRNVDNIEWRKKMRDTDADVARGTSRVVALSNRGYDAPTSDRQLRRWEKDWASPSGRRRADSDISDM